MWGMLETTLYLPSMMLTFLVEQLLARCLLFWQKFKINTEQHCTSQSIDWSIQLRLQCNNLADPSCVSLQLHQLGISNIIFMSINLQIMSFWTGARMAFPWAYDLIMHQVQPSWRTPVNYLITLNSCHS